MNFERALDPKKAMGTGTTTWENLGPGDVLCVKQCIEVYLNNDVYTLKRSIDIFGSGSFVISENIAIKIEKITKEKYRKLNMTFSYLPPLRTLCRHLKCSKKELQKYFEIKQ
jgi:hypothetical protein